MSLQNSGYTGLVLKKLTDAEIKMGDNISVLTEIEKYSGILMPRAQVGSDAHHLVIKLESGYNVGIRVNETTEIRKIGSARRTKKVTSDKTERNPNLPAVKILSTGGTIASKVDYHTGSVNPALSAQDLYDAVPELRNNANIEAKIIMSELSENIGPAGWTKISKDVASVINSGADGVVVAHGTDTLGLTSAALSFALQDLPIPVALVGSQRSSDRPSSDAAMNLIGGTDLVANADAAEVFLVMHETIGDTSLVAHRGTRARKCHTSRRDAFISINSQPIYRIGGSEIVEISKPLRRRDSTRKLKVKPKFDSRVALIKTFPGMDQGIVEYIVNSGYRGIILEGSGLGHAPENIHSSIRHALEEGLIVAMNSQCIWGRVNMNVYRSGVELQEMGVIPCEDMLPETALVKMMWLLANTKSTDEAGKKMLLDIAGEITLQTKLNEFCLAHEGV